MGVKPGTRDDGSRVISAALVIFWGSIFAFADTCGAPELLGTGNLDSRVLATGLTERGMPEMLIQSGDALQLIRPNNSIPIPVRGGKKFALSQDTLFWVAARGVMGCPIQQCVTEALVVPVTANERVADMLATGKDLFVLTERKGAFVLTHFSVGQRAAKELVQLASGSMPALNRSGRLGSVILTSLLASEPNMWRSTLYPEGTDLVALPRLDQEAWNYFAVSLVQHQVLVTSAAALLTTRNLLKTKIAGGSWELELHPRMDGELLLAEVLGSNEEKSTIALATVSRGGRGTLAKISTIQLQTGALVSQTSQLIPGEPEGVEGKYLLYSQPNQGMTQNRNFFGISCDGP